MYIYKRFIVIALLVFLGFMECQNLRGEDRADTLISQLQWMKGENRIRAIESICRMLNKRGENYTTEMWTHRFVRETVELGDVEMEREARRLRQLYYFQWGWINNMSDCMEEDLAFYEDHELWKDYYDCLEGFGSLYNNAGETNKAMEVSEQIYQHAKDRNDEFGIGVALKVQGQTFLNLRQYAQAEETLGEALTYLRKSDYRLSAVLDLYAQALQNEGKPHEAEVALNEMFQCAEADGDYASMGNSQLLKLGILVSQNRVEEATKVVQYLYSTKYVPQEAMYTFLPEYFVMMNDYDSALYYCDRYAELVNGSDWHRLMNMKVYAQIYYLKGEYQTAADCLYDILALSDTIVNEKTEARIAQMVSQYGVDKERSRNREQRIYLYSAIGAIVLLLIVFAYSLKVNNSLRRKNRAFFESISKMDDAEKIYEVQLAATPEKELSPRQKLYLQALELMKDQKPFKNPDFNRDKFSEMLSTTTSALAEAIHTFSEGMSINDFITRHRLRYAATLLKETNTPVTLIPEMAGFRGRSTFNRLFHATYGMTPSSYRNASRETPIDENEGAE